MFGVLASFSISQSRDSSVGIVTDHGLDDRGSRVRFPGGLGIFLFTTASRTALGPTQPPIQWVPGALSLGVKRPGREADHSPPSSVEIKEWMELYLHSPYTSSLGGAQLKKHRDNFIFTFYMLRSWFEYRTSPSGEIHRFPVSPSELPLSSPHLLSYFSPIRWYTRALETATFKLCKDQQIRSHEREFSDFLSKNFILTHFVCTDLNNVLGMRWYLLAVRGCFGTPFYFII
jgi:hypothetical protein